MFRYATLLACLVAVPAFATTPDEAATWLDAEIRPLIASKKCADLGKAATLLAAAQVLHDKYPDSFVDRKDMLADVLAALKKCGGSPAYLPSTTTASGLGGPVPVSSKGGGGKTSQVPATVLAYTYMSSDERAAFEAKLSDEVKVELAQYLAAHKGELEFLANSASTEVMQFRKKDLLDGFKLDGSKIKIQKPDANQ